MTQLVPELDSLRTVQSQIVTQELEEFGINEVIMEEIMNLVNEPMMEGFLCVELG